MNLSPLEKFLPENASQFLYQWLETKPVIIKIKSNRKSKLGDYKFLRETKSHQITINRDLKPEAFFFVLTHEIAHLLVRSTYSHNVKSHGVEWKQTFGQLLVESLDVYSGELQPLILKHARNPKASMAADKGLRQLLFMEEEQIGYMVENLQDKQKFRLGKRIFEKGAKRKIRYICKEIPTGKMYWVNGQAIVDEILAE